MRSLVGYKQGRLAPPAQTYGVVVPLSDELGAGVAGAGALGGVMLMSGADGALGVGIGIGTVVCVSRSMMVCGLLLRSLVLKK